MVGKKKKSIYIISLAAYGKGISGGDRIFIEFARQWSKKFPVKISVWEEGREMCRRQNLQNPNVKFQISKIKKWCRLGFLICYIARIIEGIRLGLTLKLENEKKTIIYNASEFWMDSIPCALLKFRHPEIIWAATWYQTAPNPFRGYSEGVASSKKNVERESKYNISALLYWLVQFPIKPLIKKYADYVLVNNEDERKQFPEMNKKGKVIVVIGAVRLKNIEKWKMENDKSPKVYDAVFQGRFHPQKGVVELIDIWKKVVEKKPNAKLAMIGDGSLMENVKAQIPNNKLEKNVKLFGYVFDGPKKYSIFAKSKIVVHPAFYDSGGMASAEAMAFGIPAVGFNLKSYESYYPKGMVKVEKGNLNAFAKAINELLDDIEKRKKLGKDAREMIEKNWSWVKRASDVMNIISSNI